MTNLFLVSFFYTLICFGFIVGLVIDNDDIPNAVKLLMVIFSPIVAPWLLGVVLGMIIIAKVKKETNRK